MSNKERQRRWRRKHPAQAAAHLEALEAKRAQEKKREKKSATTCRHEYRGVKLKVVYCGECRGWKLFLPYDLDNAHAKWLSRPPEFDEE